MTSPGIYRYGSGKNNGDSIASGPVKSNGGLNNKNGGHNFSQAQALLRKDASLEEAQL